MPHDATSTLWQHIALQSAAVKKLQKWTRSRPEGERHLALSCVWWREVKDVTLSRRGLELFPLFNTDLTQNKQLTKVASMNVRKNINNVLNPFLIFWMWRNGLKNRNINRLKWVYQASKHIVCYSVPTLNCYWEKEDYKSNKYDNIYAHMSWTNRPHTSKPPHPHNHKRTQTHSLPLFFSVSLSLYSCCILTFFWEDDMGDPDVAFHWPMVSREGLDWCALPMPPSFKNAWASVSDSATQLTWERAASTLRSITNTWLKKT